MLAEGIAELLRARSAERILDCACGTGLPAIDLRVRGFSVNCTDGDALMLQQFRRNARVRGVSDDCSHLQWSELDSLAEQYDYVLCRGNSLIYADTWTNSNYPAAHPMGIEGHIRAIASAVAPGGYLHIDAPRNSELAEASYPEVFFRGERVRVYERVTAAGHLRRWEQHVIIGHEENYFVRYSSNLTSIQLAVILRRNGFDHIEPLELPGERPSYGVLIAQKLVTGSRTG